MRDEALADLIRRWPSLPPAIRAAIVAMVGAVPTTTPDGATTPDAGTDAIP